jgi:hypothetical protein
MLPVSGVSFSADGVFAMASGIDKRLHIYVIADPLEPLHTDRLKLLSSRQQPLLTDPLDIIGDPRYKFIKDVTGCLEGSSSDPDFVEMLQDRQVLSSDEEAVANDAETTQTLSQKPAGSKKLNKRKSKNVQTRRSFMQNANPSSATLVGTSAESPEEHQRSFQNITKHATSLAIQYNGPCLQYGAQGRMSQLWNDGRQYAGGASQTRSRPSTKQNNKQSRSSTSGSDWSDHKPRIKQIQFTNKTPFQ